MSRTNFLVSTHRYIRDPMRLVSICCVLLAAAASADAQPASVAATQVQVRGVACSADGSATVPFAGRFISDDASWIVIQRAEASPIDTIPLARVLKLERAEGPPDTMLSTLTVVGGVLGFFLGRPSHSTTRSGDNPALILYPILGTLGGAVAGGLIGSQIKIRKWRAVPLGQGAGMACRHGGNPQS